MTWAAQHRSPAPRSAETAGLRSGSGPSARASGWAPCMGGNGTLTWQSHCECASPQGYRAPPEAPPEPRPRAPHGPGDHCPQWDQETPRSSRLRAACPPRVAARTAGEGRRNTRSRAHRRADSVSHLRGDARRGQAPGSHSQAVGSEWPEEAPPALRNATPEPATAHGAQTGGRRPGRRRVHGDRLGPSDTVEENPPPP